MERWVRPGRHEFLARALIWSPRHLLYSPREFEHFYNYNEHRPIDPPGYSALAPGTHTSYRS